MKIHFFGNFTEFYTLRVFDVMTKAFDKTLGAYENLVDAIELLKTDITISDPHKIVDLQNIVSLLDKSSDLVIDAIIVFGKYENLR